MHCMLGEGPRVEGDVVRLHAYVSGGHHQRGDVDAGGDNEEAEADTNQGAFRHAEDLPRGTSSEDACTRSVAITPRTRSAGSTSDA